MSVVDRARVLRKKIEEISAEMTDQTASEVAELFPYLKGDGRLILAGTRINWNGTIKRATTALWDNAENAPDVAPTLWEDIEYREGYRIIPEMINSSAAFALDECGWWGDILYRSKITANVYTPDQNASGWEKIG